MQTARGVCVRLSSALAVALFASLLTYAPTTHAAQGWPNPVSGTTKWAILLCTFADKPNNPPAMQPPASFFEDLFTEKGAGKGGMFDYWKTVSYGNIDVTGSRVFGWFQQKQTLADHLLLGGKNPAGRHEKMQACIDAAQADKTFPAADVARDFYGIIAIWNDGEDTWGGKPDSYSINGSSRIFGTAAFNPAGWAPAIVAQEMGHGYGLDHSRATDPDPTVDYMDPWDPMSAWTYGNINRPTYINPIFGESGPSMNVGYRDVLGWLPSSLVTLVSAGGPTQRVTIADVDHPELGLPLMIKVARGPTLYDSVALKLRQGWNSAILHDAVLVHEVRPDGRTYIVNPGTFDRGLAVGDTFSDPTINLHVYVESIDPSALTATVQVGAIPPTTTASISPTPNAQGYSPATTVSFKATGAPSGPAVASISYASQTPSAQFLMGSFRGSSGSLQITRDGTTTLSYFATDTAGAYEGKKTLALNIDATPPQTVASSVQVPGRGVQVVFVASDSASGVSSVSYQRFTMTTTDPVVTTAGDRAWLITPATGLTEIAYWATDNVGNVEPMQTIRLQPWLSLSQPSVSFGSQVIGTTSAPRTVSITNSGSMELAVSSVVASSEFQVAAPGAGTPCAATPFKLAAGATCALGVTFAPVGPYPPGRRTGTLTINHNGANGTSVPGVSSFALDGNGIGVPHLKLGQSTLQFSSTRVGTPNEQFVSLTNDGWDTLLIGSVAISSGTADFGVGTSLPPAPYVACPTAPGSALGAGQTCLLPIAFHPSTAGLRSGQLALVSNSNNVPGATAALGLSGTGVEPRLDVTPSSLSMSPKAPQTVTLTSSGSMSVQILTWMLTGPDAAAFRLATPTCGFGPLRPGMFLEQGMVCTLPVAFVPPHPGTFSATLQIHDSTAAGMHQVQLTGVAP